MCLELASSQFALALLLRGYGLRPMSKVACLGEGGGGGGDAKITYIQEGPPGGLHPHET